MNDENARLSYIDFLEIDDKRIPRYQQQIEERGWDDTQLWQLDKTIIRFALPRIKRLKEIQHGFPGNLTENEWDDTIDAMVAEMELYLADESLDSSTFHSLFGDKLPLFKQYFHQLWD